ncbi:MAG: DUF4872 domain-containing protein [Gemmatimonadota bacterium]
MTDQGDFKQLVRERMVRTGERYTTARAHVLGSHRGATDVAALAIGGVHDQTSALRDLFAAEGIDAPHTQLPPSEALLLGLGGGIGAAVFTFQYKGELPHLYVETRCSPQFAYDLAFVQRAAAGLGASLHVVTGTTSKAAARALDSALASGHPALCLLDANALPHHVGSPQGALPWVVVVHEQHGDVVVVTDRSQLTLEIPRATLDAARAAFAKGKGAVATLIPGPVGSLEAGILTGIRYCIAELAGREVRKGFAGNFGLRALDKWIGEIVKGGKEGWRARFAPGKPLAAALRQGYGWIETSGTGGGAFRGLYADFLREAAVVTGNTQLVAVARRYDALAVAWTGLFASLMPEGTPLGEMRRQLHERMSAVRRGGSSAELAAIDSALGELVGECEPFPGDGEATYLALAKGLREIVAEERAAVAGLKDAVEAR